MHVMVTAWVNSAHESLEITRWIDSSEEIERVYDQMLALAQRLYPKLSRRKKDGRIMTAVGDSGESSKPSHAHKHPNTLHYALYEGRCLDQKKLSYFVPDRTLEEGNLTEQEVQRLLKRKEKLPSRI